MSDTTTLAHELRLMARLVRDYDYKEISRMLREAADTIISLRDRLQAVGETCERTTTRNGKFKTKYGRKVPLCECCGYAIGDDRYNFCPKCGAKIVEAVKR